LSDQHVQKMAPQQKKTGLPKKIAAKKTSLLKKTAPKKTGSKTMTTKKISPKKKPAPKKKVALKKITPKKVAPRKTAPKKATPKKTAPKRTLPKKTGPKKASPKKSSPKKAALKKKIATKRSAKVGESLAKRDSAKGKKKKISKSAEERAARAARRSLAKEAPDVKEPLSKRARLDSSSDLVNLLSTSAPVRHILAASGSRHMPKEAEVSLEASNNEALGKDALKDISFELDHLLGASPASASVLDIIAASGSRTLPNVALAEVLSEDGEAGGSKIVDYQLDGLVESLMGAGPVTASILDIAAASGSRALSREAFAEDEKAVEAGQDSLLAANQTTSTRARKVYVSPALLWLEEEGLPSAEKEAQDKAVEGEMDKEAVLRKWKRLSVEEKAVWRKRAEEHANINKK